MPSKGSVAPRPSPLTEAREAWAKNVGALRNAVRGDRVDLANQCIYAMRREGKLVTHRECTDLLRELERGGNSVNDEDLLGLVRNRATAAKSVAQELLEAARGADDIEKAPRHPKRGADVGYFSDAPRKRKQSTEKP